MIWKHKVAFHIYQIHDAFLGYYRAILTRTVLDKFTEEVKYFLEGKGLLYLEEEYSFIRTLDYKENHILFPKFITDMVSSQKYVDSIFLGLLSLKRSASASSSKFHFLLLMPNLGILQTWIK